MKKSFTADQKVAVVLETYAGVHTLAEISSQHEVHATQISIWKQQAQRIHKEGFSDKRKKDSLENERKIASLHEIIGKREYELEWFKKKLEPFGT